MLSITIIKLLLVPYEESANGPAEFRPVGTEFDWYSDSRYCGHLRDRDLDLVSVIARVRNNKVREKILRKCINLHVRELHVFTSTLRIAISTPAAFACKQNFHALFCCIVKYTGESIIMVFFIE